MFLYWGSLACGGEYYRYVRKSNAGCYDGSFFPMGRFAGYVTPRIR